MTRVHLLTQPPSASYTRGFAAPLLSNRRRIRDLGLDFKFFTTVDRGFTDCDIVFINSNIYGPRWKTQGLQICSEISELADRVGAVVYCDTYDSTGLVRAEVLPLVRLYLKTHLLRDRSSYGRSFYGGRIFTDYYHRVHGIVDDDPLCSDAITDPAQIEKLDVSWNMGLADHSYLGNVIAKAFARLPVHTRQPVMSRFVAPSTTRTVDVSLRFAQGHRRKTVRYQRQEIARRLGGGDGDARLSMRGFFQELARSRIVVSPFGWGEFAVRDYESFLCGALLLKPDMAHLETYPDHYRDGETMISFKWDLSDIEEKVHSILANYGDYVGISQAGQDTYRRHSATPEAGEQFAARFKDIVRRGLS